MFERPHHQAIALVLGTLDGNLLREYRCLFGGGTAIALRHGEYRESVDMDFLVSDLACYRNLRQLVGSGHGLQALFRPDAPALAQAADVRADQYGIRTQLAAAGRAIKFEIVLEARIQLEDPGADDAISGIATLTALDMATTKLLANSDRWRDDGVFSRDLIDLALMSPSPRLLAQAVAKAEIPYGAAVLRDLAAAIANARERQGWLERCMHTMGMTLPKALLWQKIRNLQKALPAQ